MDIDAQIGRNVLLLRGSLSQQEVADSMRALGWKWSQATVWSVEKGERPMRLAEAQDLAEVLKVSISNFLQPDTTTMLQLEFREIWDRHSSLRRAMRSFLRAQANMAAVADAHSGESAWSRDVDVSLRTWLQVTPERVANEVRERFAPGWVNPDGAFRHLYRDVLERPSHYTRKTIEFYSEIVEALEVFGGDEDA